MAKFKCDKCGKTEYRTGKPSRYYQGEPCPRVMCVGTLVKK